LLNPNERIEEERMGSSGHEITLKGTDYDAANRAAERIRDCVWARIWEFVGVSSFARLADDPWWADDEGSMELHVERGGAPGEIVLVQWFRDDAPAILGHFFALIVAESRPVLEGIAAEEGLAWVAPTRSVAEALEADSNARYVTLSCGLASVSRRELELAGDEARLFVDPLGPLPQITFHRALSIADRAVVAAAIAAPCACPICDALRPGDAR
jgi:hypothetical protein